MNAATLSYPVVEAIPQGQCLISLRPKAQTFHIPPIRSAQSLLENTALVAPPELVSGLLHRSTKAVLAGSSKVGKTWLLLDLSIAVASGGQFLRWNTTQGRVLFINMEIQSTFFRDRIRTAAAKRGLEAVENLDVLNLRGRTAQPQPFLSQLAERLENQDYSMIVIDPIYKLMVGKSENSAAGVGQLCHGIERLIERSNAAVVYSHHFTKGNQSRKKAMDRLSGSGVFARDADTILTFTEHEAEGCYIVESILRNLPSPEPFVVEWEYPTMNLRPDLNPADFQKCVRKDDSDVLGFLLMLIDDQALTSSEWEEAAVDAGISRATFYRKCAYLKATGEIQQAPDSKRWKRVVQEVSPSLT